MRKSVFLLLTLGAVMVLPLASWADSSCIGTGDGRCLIFEQGAGSFDTTQPTASTTVTVPGFNPALGTLDEVGCSCGASVNGTATMTITATNPAPFPEPLTFGKAVAFLFVGTPSRSNFPVYADGVDELFCTVGPLDPGATTTTTCVDNGLELHGNTFGVSPKDLAGFVSTGNVVLPVSLDVVMQDGFGDNIATFDSVSMSFEVGVVYIYTPTQVPEPASVILLITAMAVAGPFLWMRRSPRR